MPTTTPRRSPHLILALALGLATLATTTVPAAASSERATPRATATLHDTSGSVVGSAVFHEDRRGAVHVRVVAEGLTPGDHGLHIHAVGDCTPPFTAAGPHQNPTSTTHGSHAGDLPNLSVNPTGRGHQSSTTTRATLSPGPTSVFDVDSSALVIHAGPDDLVTDPTGNSGGRVACGVIEPG